MKTFKTPKGTVLPLLDLRGKDYLQVAHRLVWFREECPKYRIATSLLESEKDHCIAMATIFDEEGKQLANAHKREDRQSFADFMEKAETGAIGRALAMCGYGTQFCADDLDEGERIVDSPFPSAQLRSYPTVAPKVLVTPPNEDLGEYVINCGKKYIGKKLKSVDPTQLQGFVDWVKNNVDPNDTRKNAAFIEFVQYAEAFLAQGKEDDLDHALATAHAKDHDSGLIQQDTWANEPMPEWINETPPFDTPNVPRSAKDAINKLAKVTTKK